MTTRMQQRRGTAAQWTSGNPVLAAGEIGFETNTNKFKIGDGTSTWSALKYFLDIEKLNIDTEGFVRDDMKGEPNGVASLNGNGQIPISQLGLLINAAPQALDTLGELADAVEEIANIATGITSTHAAVTTNVHGIVDTSVLATATTVATAKSEAITAADTSAVTKIATAKSEAIAAAGTAADTKVSDAVANETTNRGIAIATALSSATSALSAHESDTTNVHGIVDTSVLATNSSVNTAISTAITDFSADTTNVHGIADTSLLATISGAAAGVETHRLDTTDVHGIADTSVLATATTVADAKTEAIAAAGTAADTKISTAVAGLTKSSVGLSNVDNTTDAGKPISTAVQTALDLKSPLASPTFTGIVSGITKTMVGLGSADNTADTAKPVSTAQATAIATAKAEAIADATSQVNALLTGAPAALNTLDELAAALGDDANFASTVTTNLAAKAPLASPTFTGTVTVAAAGVAFTDGTQTKAGVPSITSIPTAIAAGAHALEAGRADQFIPLTGAVVITLPASGYSTGQSIDFWQETGTGASFASTNGVVGTPGRNFRTTNSVVTAMKTAAGWLVFGDLAL